MIGTLVALVGDFIPWIGGAVLLIVAFFANNKVQQNKGKKKEQQKAKELDHAKAKEIRKRVATTRDTLVRELDDTGFRND